MRRTIERKRLYPKFDENAETTDYTPITKINEWINTLWHLLKGSLFSAYVGTLLAQVNAKHNESKGHNGKKITKKWKLEGQIRMLLYLNYYTQYQHYQSRINCFMSTFSK